MPKRKTDNLYVEKKWEMSRSRWRSRKSANCILDSEVFTIMGVGTFMLHERNLKEITCPKLLNQRVKGKYCKICHDPKMKNGLAEALRQKLKKKNLLIINCLSAGLLFLLANKGKKNF